MSGAYVWVAAYFSHSTDEFVQAFWIEEHQPGPWEAGVSPPPGCVPDVAPGEVKEDSVVRTAVTVSVIPAAATESVVLAGGTGSCSRDIKCPGLDWDSSSGDGDTYHASRSSDQRLLAPWISSSFPPAEPPDSRVPTTPPVSLLPG